MSETTPQEIDVICVLDNYDSFVYNLVQYLGELNSNLEVFRSDKISVDELLELNPSHIVISPGPCTPNEAGISMELIQRIPGHIPLLGVCLGHQAIAQALGGSVVRGEAPLHGKVFPIKNDGTGIFRGLPSRFEVTRYHSLVVDSNLPPELIINATSDDGVVMGIRHLFKPIWGVQFHPESLCTEYGMQMLQNFLQLQGSQNL